MLAYEVFEEFLNSGPPFYALMYSQDPSLWGWACPTM